MMFSGHKETSKERHVFLSFCEVQVYCEYRLGHIKLSFIHCFFSTYKWLSVPDTTAPFLPYILTDQRLAGRHVLHPLIKRN